MTIVAVRFLTHVSSPTCFNNGFWENSAVNETRRGSV